MRKHGPLEMWTYRILHSRREILGFECVEVLSFWASESQEQAVALLGAASPLS